LSKPVVFVTGIAGNLGLRLLPQLDGFSVVGFDLFPPRIQLPQQFIAMDLGEETSCRDFYHLLVEHKPVAVVHLAFVIDQVRNGVLDVDHMWRINVAGTARVLEAVSEANRPPGRTVSKLIFPSSVSAYGPSLPHMVTEDHPLAAHTLPYAIHKMESDLVVQKWASALRGAQAYILRPHIFAGASMENYLVGAFRGTPNGKSERATKMRREGTRLPCMLPYGEKYTTNQLQFVHVDDMARLIAHILRRGPEPDPVSILNVAGRGEAMTFGACVEIARARLVRTPGKWAMRQALQFVWNRGISAIPPEALPYMTGTCTMNTSRLQAFLGGDYLSVMQYTIEDAYRDCFVAGCG
jgi:nucleoside-diphosphate-sugar epimerase